MDMRPIKKQRSCIGTLNDEPALTVTDRVVWRVPVDLTNPEDGRIGRVGEVDVDVESGELLLTENQISPIKQNALHLTADASFQQSTRLQKSWRLL